MSSKMQCWENLAACVWENFMEENIHTQINFPSDVDTIVKSGS